MKKYSMVLGLMMLSSLIIAQGKGDPKKRVEAQADRMKTELSLDDVQYKSIKSINEEYAGKHFKLRSDSTLSKEARHQQLRTLHLEKDAAVKKVLTLEQKAKWESDKSVQPKKHRDQMKKPHGDRALRMQKDLSLSAEQTAKIKSIDKEFATQFHTVRSDSTLAKADTQERIKKLKEEHATKTKSVLTDEQLKKWEAQRAEWKRKKSR